MLWRNIATTLMMLHGYSGRNKEGDGMYFAVLARLCNLVPLLTKYVPLGEFWQAYSGEHTYPAPQNLLNFSLIRLREL